MFISRHFGNRRLKGRTFGLRIVLAAPLLGYRSIFKFRGISEISENLQRTMAYDHVTDQQRITCKTILFQKGVGDLSADASHQAQNVMIH